MMLCVPSRIAACRLHANWQDQDYYPDWDSMHGDSNHGYSD